MKQIDDAIKAIRAALAALEAGERPCDEAGVDEDASWRLACGGHGLNNQAIVFSWRGPQLVIDYRLPWDRAFVSEDTREDDAVSIRAALCMAILILSDHAAGHLLAEGEAKLFVKADEEGDSYRIENEAGETMDDSSDWRALVARLETIEKSANDDLVQIIRP